jgi:phage gp29-like protein
MSSILDQYGRPIEAATFEEPQTSRVTTLQNQYLTPMLGGLTPARLARTLREADNGQLLEQHRLFADMEERDGHLRAEMDKRKLAVAGVPWSVVPPRNPSKAEKYAADWLTETLQDAVDPLEELIISLMEGVGHGFSAIELEWRYEGNLQLPSYHPQPQEWLQLDQSRTNLTLRDGSIYGAPLNPFGWIVHTPSKAKSGYMGRLGLYRTLVWPFIYKAYALGDFAEFLETYGLPIIMGKYFAGATSDEKASLMRAVTALGHDARAIMPDQMSVEIQDVSAKGGGDAHLAMMSWAEASISKSILGQTLSADTGSKGGGSYALGKVHNEVRHDISRSDGRSISATLTRDLAYPLVAVNLPGIDGLARCPRVVLNTSTPEDMAAYADALPKLVGVGFKVPRTWAQDKVHIPEPQDGEDVLILKQVVSGPDAPGSVTDETASLSAVVPPSTKPAASNIDPMAGAVDQLGDAAAPLWSAQIAQLTDLVDRAGNLAALQGDLLATFGDKPQEELVKLMSAGYALAQLRGMADVAGEA